MNPMIRYLVEANLSVGFFLLLYRILLKGETDYRFKRVYLLAALAVSATLPFLRLPLPPLFAFDQAAETHWLPEIRISALTSGAAAQLDSSWIYRGYVLGAAFFGAAFVIRLVKMMATLYRSPCRKQGRAWVVELKGEGEVFSFFKFIFIGKSMLLSEYEKKQIIAHEQIHMENYHSLDILFVNILGIFFWFNPLIKTYRNVFVQLHEFEADARSVEPHEVDSYCRLLAKAALKSSGYPLANHFTNSLTLKRIEMMKTVQTKIAKWKIGAIAGAAMAFCVLVAGNGSTLAQVKADQKNSSGDEIFDQVDELPTFGTGHQFSALYEYIAKNLQYPADARKRRVEGKVYAEFVVEKDGSLSNVKVAKGIGAGCDEAVVRVVKSLPKWNPGQKDGKIVRTRFTLPVVFKM
jgi:TonB family protein